MYPSFSNWCFIAVVTCKAWPGVNAKLSILTSHALLCVTPTNYWWALFGIKEREAEPEYVTGEAVQQLASLSLKMPKKFKGENSKASVARERKAAVREAEEREKKKREEDERWKDEDKHVLRKQERKVNCCYITGYWFISQPFWNVQDGCIANLVCTMLSYPSHAYDVISNSERQS